jgi:DNA-binding transcriptional regulator GbsR (MarR family)
MEIKTLQDWDLVERELMAQIHLVRYNPDLNKMKRNIDTMVRELSKAEVEARRIKNLKYLQPKIDEVNQAISRLEKSILILLLSQ